MEEIKIILLIVVLGAFAVLAAFAEKTGQGYPKKTTEEETTE